MGSFRPSDMLICSLMATAICGEWLWLPVPNLLHTAVTPTEHCKSHHVDNASSEHANTTSSPMGTDTVLFPVSWEGDWPILDPMKGVMSGWPLPPYSRDVSSIGPFVDETDHYNFEPGSALPSHFLIWRFP